MIINFTVQNFGSIKDKQTLSFEADKSTHLEDTYIIQSGKHRILKLALIYGANASGKTTILKALNFLGSMVMNPLERKTDELDFTPFLFDADTPNQNSFFAIEFLQNEIKYLYEVEFSKKAIVSEALYSYNNSRKANVFKRTTDLEKQLTKIGFGSKINIDAISEKTLTANTLWNNTVLGGFLKTNIECKELQEVVDWFGNYLNPLIYTKTQLDGFVTKRIGNKDISKSDILSILKKADLNISDIVLKEENEKTEKFRLDGGGISGFEEIEIVPIKTELEHTIDGSKYYLPLELESEGTKRYYGFAGLLALLTKTSTVFPIDELETSLHPDLYMHFLLSFLLNAKNSQLIATTHNRELLNDKDLFRNDAIWFTNKGEDCATELYSLADFDTSVIRDTTNILNAYKSGKLSGTPNLGDTYID